MNSSNHIYVCKNCKTVFIKATSHYENVILFGLLSGFLYQSDWSSPCNALRGWWQGGEGVMWDIGVSLRPVVVRSGAGARERGKQVEQETVIFPSNFQRKAASILHKYLSFQSPPSVSVYTHHSHTPGPGQASQRALK